MTDFNDVVLIGRLTRDAELRYTNSNLAVCKFSIANNQRRKQENAWVDEAHFFDVTLWGKTAESLHKYLVKGKQVAVEGQLRQSRWEKDGQTRSRVEINANNIQLLGGSQGAAGPSQAGPAEQSFEQPSESPAGGESFEDDIPFENDKEGMAVSDSDAKAQGESSAGAGVERAPEAAAAPIERAQTERPAGERPQTDRPAGDRPMGERAPGERAPGERQWVSAPWGTAPLGSGAGRRMGTETAGERKATTAGARRAADSGVAQSRSSAGRSARSAPASSR